MLRNLVLIVLLAITSVSVVSEWSIQLEQGYPTIAFSAAAQDSEILFKYDFGGNVSYLTVAVKQFDCIQPKDDGLAFVKNTTMDNLFVGVDVVEASITNSVHYSPINETAASVNFCVRINYVLQDANSTESIQLSETPVSITVDLTANFTLRSVSLIKDAADEALANAKVDYELDTYYCNNDNKQLGDPPVLSQGSTLQVCVRVDPSVTADVYVEDVLVFVVSQPSSTVTLKSVAIVDGQPDILTTKVCTEDGVCNIQTSIPSKFFTEEGDTVRVDGVAVLSFGRTTQLPTIAPTGTPPPGQRRGEEIHRRLRVPVSGLIRLPIADLTTRRFLSSENVLFGLEVPLLSPTTDDTPGVQDTAQAQSNNQNLLVYVCVGVLGLSLVGCFVNAALAYHKRLQKEHHQDCDDAAEDESGIQDAAVGLLSLDNCAITIVAPPSLSGKDEELVYPDCSNHDIHYLVEDADVSKFDDGTVTVLSQESPSYQSRDSVEDEPNYRVTEGSAYSLDDDVIFLQESPPTKALGPHSSGEGEKCHMRCIRPGVYALD